MSAHTVVGPSPCGPGGPAAATRRVANTHTRVSSLAQTLGRHAVSSVPRLSFHAAFTRHNDQRDDVADVGVCSHGARARGLSTHDPPNNRPDESDEELPRFFDDGPGFTSAREQECQSLDGVGSPGRHACDSTRSASPSAPIGPRRPPITRHLDVKARLAASATRPTVQKRCESVST